eukprot:m.18480 g.18480  ORF g.18480 m.18480 type:complete len:91 (+) comp10817_c0_seq1:166-438(+)
MAWYSNPFFKFGIPMFTTLVLGSLGLRELMSLRVEMRDERKHKLTGDEIAKMTNKPKQQFDIHGELRRLSAEMDLDEWDQVRAPRPEAEA